MADYEKVVAWLNEIVDTLGSFTDESEQEVCQFAKDALELLKEYKQLQGWATGHGLTMCKDCKWRNTNACFSKSPSDVKDEWFCSEGELR